LSKSYFRESILKVVDQKISKYFFHHDYKYSLIFPPFKMDRFRNVLDVFGKEQNLPKIHDLRHLTTGSNNSPGLLITKIDLHFPYLAIKKAGDVSSSSTELGEQSQKVLCKDPYRRSNKKGAESQVSGLIFPCSLLSLFLILFFFLLTFLWSSSSSR